MLHQEPHAPTPQPTLILPAKVCVCCGRKLKPTVKHTETPLGPIGPECERKADVTAALDRLARSGLEHLPEGIRLSGIASDTGMFRFPEAAFEELKAKAAAAGIRLRWRVDSTARQFIVTIHADSIPDLLKSNEVMA